jgi:CheY-like chemotaxis protein
MRILIVEDSVDVRNSLKKQFAEIPGAEIVGEAADAASAERACRELRPDAITLDIRLAHGNGIDVLRRIRRDGSPVKVIVLTNYPDAQYRKACANAGADFFFDKSTEFEKVTHVLKKMAAFHPPRTALVIEDNNLVQGLLESILEREGFTVVLATESGAARRELAARGSELDLVVADLRLKGDESGWDIIRAIRNDPRTGNIPIVAMSGAILSPRERLDLEKHAAAFIPKHQFDVKRFVAVVNAVVDGS